MSQSLSAKHIDPGNNQPYSPSSTSPSSFESDDKMTTNDQSKPQIEMDQQQLHEQQTPIAPTPAPASTPAPVPSTTTSSTTNPVKEEPSSTVTSSPPKTDTTTTTSTTTSPPPATATTGKQKGQRQKSKGTVPIPKKSALIKTDKPRPHVCPTCTRGFARLEHLKRHERSHTNEKPFQCAACGRCFARRDLVLRHQQKLHSSLPTNNRQNAQRKGKSKNQLNGEGGMPKDGEVVSDYLNDNINIVSNNTANQLPLPVNKNHLVNIADINALAHQGQIPQANPSPATTSTTSPTCD
ncbi:unnamed protein product [Ambrosiozyma monospora]|uniref:Unnamed protein product n=1 Tax=Ambrosiozyma monospora TaxID=43982 RepID=A0ACB5T4D4_AMBMO|nr:unnamed protein product [Ambrosiozyma monospora]